MDHIIDATHQPLGRLASRIAMILQDKSTPRYHPRFSGEDRVIVKNASKIELTGKKVRQKMYYRHTGYMGHLRRTTLAQLFSRSPEKVIEHAVTLMLPRNSLRRSRLRRLHIER